MDAVITIIKSHIGHVGTENIINAAILMRNKYGMEQVTKLVTINMTYLNVEQAIIFINGIANLDRAVHSITLA